MHRNQFFSSDDHDHGMPPSAEDDKISPPLSFNDFSFKQIGMARPSLLARLNMSSQSDLPPAPTEIPALVSPSPEIPMDGSVPSPSEMTPSVLATSTTADSSSPSDPNMPTNHGNVFVPEPIRLNPAGPALASNSPRSASVAAMEVDELIDLDVVEFTPDRQANPLPRIPESYRALPANHYLVAPPADLPYPRSPILRFSEGHPLHVAPSLFAHLPRAPPRSPRLDPLAVLELESERERSEWEQIRKDLARPTPDLFSAASTLVAPPAIGPPAPPAESAPLVLASAEASSPAPMVASETGYDSDSSDVELRVYDNSPVEEVAPITQQGATQDQEFSQSNSNASATRTSLPPISNRLPPVEPLGSTTLAAVPEETSLATNPPTQRLSPNRLSPGGKALSPKPNASGASEGDSAAPLANAEQVGSPERSTTPAKRKHDAMDDLVQKQGNGATSTVARRQTSAEAGHGRLGVPPPFRAQVDRVPAAKAVAAEPSPPSNPVIAETVPDLNGVLSTDASRLARFGSQAFGAPATGPQANGQQPAERQICRFHNRPPGRVCIRKEACPDLHQGPLMKPLTVASYLSTNISSNAATLPARPLSSADRHVPPLCTFFLSNRCTRGSECAFSHDTASQQTTPQAASFDVVDAGGSGSLTQALGTSPMLKLPPTTQMLRKETQVAQPKPKAQAPRTQRAQDQTIAPIPKPIPTFVGGVRQVPVPRPQPQMASTVSRVSPGSSVVPEPATPAPPPAMKKEDMSSADADVKIKAERPSPSPNPAKKAAVPRVKKPRSRKVKEEDVTLYDLACDPAVPVDKEMADNPAGESSTSIILPAPLSTPMQPTPARQEPIQTRSVAQSKASAKPPATIRPVSSLPAKPTASVISAAVAAPPPAPTPALTTVVIPPTPVPVRAPVTKSTEPPASQGVPPRKTPSPIPPQPAQRQRSRDSRRLGPEAEPEHREPVNRAQNPPARKVSGRRTDSYRPAYDDQIRGRRSSSRSKSPPRSRGQSPPRSRLRSPSPVRGSNGYQARLPRPQRRRSLSPTRFDSYERQDETRRFLGRPRYYASSRSRSPDDRRYPPTLSQNGRGPVRRASPPRRISHWSRSPISRSPSPPPGVYRRPSYTDRVQDYRPAADSRPPAPPTRSPLSQPESLGNQGYVQDGGHHPQETAIPRAWETYPRQVPPQVGQVRYDDNAGINQNVQDTRPLEQAYPRSSGEVGRDVNYEPRTGRLDYPVGLPLESSTPDRPPAPSEDFRQINERNPTAALNNYDNFEQSMAMEMSSPELSPVNLPATPAYPTSGAENGASLYARMGHDSEQLPLAARMASNQSNQVNKPSYTKGQKPNSFDNRGQLASRLGVSTGEKAPPLANRLGSDAQSWAAYQGRMENREPPSRGGEMIGGGLMARLVGKKPA